MPIIIQQPHFQQAACIHQSLSFCKIVTRTTAHLQQGLFENQRAARPSWIQNDYLSVN